MDRIGHPKQNVKYVVDIERTSIELLFSPHYIQPGKAIAQKQSRKKGKEEVKLNETQEVKSNERMV